jgi:hypothetical protein
MSPAVSVGSNQPTLLHESALRCTMMMIHTPAMCSDHRLEKYGTEVKHISADITQSCL